ncbi:hypothetical protein VTK73DRAFT_4297 [Phialemonium thermophilum]|uniref:BZIP domain-containing protein n=1 Tax=Phialemonium thermophilum TaxID=223376 RepID=A0ABR3WUK9_9PEZI
MDLLDDFSAFGGGDSATAFSSPGLQTGYDLSASVSSSATNVATVSPQDLLIQDPFMSAPNSAALTALTSPSTYSGTPPMMGNHGLTSPEWEKADFVPDYWYPLFPPQKDDSPSSGSDSPEKSDGLEATESTHSGRRKKSGTPGRHSSVSGVGSRKRDKPLPPIVVEDPNDVVALKRARNTLAARKSRQRKAERFEELEEKIAKLEAERDYWKKKALGYGLTEEH